MSLIQTRFSRVVLAVLLLLSGTAASTVKSTRSGGFPKFPASACGARAISWMPEREPRVVGGEVPPYGAVPWQVELRRGDQHQCGGALISNRLVLTAAHCYEEGLTAVGGAHGITGTSPFEQLVPVERGILHPNFRQLGPYSHDIAVLLLAKPGMNINLAVTPACFSHDSPPPGTWCEVSGWGASDPKTPDQLSPVLRSAAVPLLSLETCRKEGIYGGRQQPILDSMLCAGHLRGGIDACGGDSGGPLVCERYGRYELIGIVSWGDGCAKKDRPGVYTRVASFAPWIKSCAQKFGVDLQL
ncbi:trypsin-2-like [Harmonia axyridis]|uniref:Serine protease 33 n=1 Tax=Harmonia axyridis TaxID=115357 RepID=A0A873BEV6_HARAX|nr:trypsin-2-like [Harmonia axyridis]QOY58047.1 serine protease 33 [Harmonia axyridis]